MYYLPSGAWPSTVNSLEEEVRGIDTETPVAGQTFTKTHSRYIVYVGLFGCVVVLSFDWFV